MRTMRQSGLTWWITLVVSIGLIWLGNHFGYWWGAMVVGFVIGVVGLGASQRLNQHAKSAERYTRAVVCALLAGLLGWTLPLVWRSLHAPVWEASDTISGVMGFGTSAGFAVVILTGVVGLLLSLVACWFGTAIRRLIV